MDLFPHQYYAACPIDIGLEDCVRCVQVHTMPEAYLVAGWVEDRMRALAYPPADLFAVRLTLLEAVANAIQHGHGNDPRKAVRVNYVVRPREVVMEVRDQGHGFDPAAVADCRLDQNVDKPRGRGIFLMQTYSTELHFNRPGNQVTLCRRRTES